MAKKTDLPKLTKHFEEAITMTGYGLFNYLIILATGGSLMSVIIETMCMMFIIPAAQCDLKLNLIEKGLLSSVSFLGIVSSSFFWGYLADTRGRRKILTISLWTSSIITFVCSIIPWDWLFISLRFANGFFIGAASSVIYAYTGEFHDNYHRPKIISWISVFVSLGNMYLPALAWLILPQKWEFDIDFLDITFKPWRLLMILYGMPTLCFGIFLYFLPESPKYLLTQEKNEETLEILRTMFEMNQGKNKEEYPVGEIIWTELQENTKDYGMFKSLWIQTKPLFTDGLLVRTIMLCIIQFGLFLSTSGVLMWYPEILNTMSDYIKANPHREVSMCTAIIYDEEHDIHNFTETNYKPNCKDTINTEVFSVSLIIGTAYAFTYIAIGMIIVYGKKKLMVALLVTVTICGFAAQFVYGYSLIQFLIGIFLMGATGIGLTNAIAVDMFPTKVRAMAFAVSLMFGRFGAMTGTNIVGPLLYNYCDYLFYIIAVDHIIIIIIVLLLPTGFRKQKEVE